MSGEGNQGQIDGQDVMSQHKYDRSFKIVGKSQKLRCYFTLQVIGYITQLDNYSGKGVPF